MATQVSKPTERPRRLVGTSLKMYFDYHSTLTYIEDAKKAYQTAKKGSEIDFFLIPDFVTLSESKRLLKDTDILLGAQDSWHQDRGSFTGEVSPVTLSQAGVRYVEIGHAERRKDFGETDEVVAKKAAAIVRNDMTPLVCIGEKQRSSNAGDEIHEAVSECEPQMRAALRDIPDDASVIFAYEPVWAIGKSIEERAQPKYIVEVTQGLRELVAHRKGSTRIIYGGSASKNLFRDIKEGVDGLFLGRFAHNVDDLKQIIEEVSEP